MESFSDMLRKLQEAHEREVEVWQVKVRELSNKKGCDSKRMEELFSRNQQMKEQQRLLTENIRTLENRLRAGLCDRCTVTQEMAKRQQQEFEASQIQSLQHISILAGEMTNLKKEILKLKDENRALRAALNRGSGDPSSSSSSSSAEHKTNGSPDQSPRSRSINLISPTPGRSRQQPADGDVVIKVEADQRIQEIECRELKGASCSGFEVLRPHSSPAWKTEPSIAPAPEKRAQSIEVLDQHPTIPSHGRNSSHGSVVEVKPRRPVVPIPCHPRAINNNPLSVPWHLPEPSNWANVAAMVNNHQMQNTRLHLPHFPNLIAPPPTLSPKKHGFSASWHKHSIPRPFNKESTAGHKLDNTREHVDNQPKPPEKKDPPPYRAERAPEEVTRDAHDGPLDLSDRGKPNPNQRFVDETSAGEGRVRRSSENDGRSRIPTSSPSLCALPSSSHSTPQTPQNHESGSEHRNGVIKEQEQKEEVIKRTEQSNGKKVPLSLRPAVVMLETLNSALQKQESRSSNGKLSKLSSPANVVDSSSDEHDENLSSCGRESAPNGKRKRTTMENETDRDKSNVQPERRVKIRMRPEEKSPS